MIILILYFSFKQPLLGLLICLEIIGIYQYHSFYVVENFDNNNGEDSSNENNIKYVDFVSIAKKDKIEPPTENHSLKGNNVKSNEGNNVSSSNKNKYCNAKQKIPHSLLRSIYPELEFDNGKTCDPCDDNCRYSIVQDKISTEHNLVFPKNSKDYEELIKTRSSVENYGGIFTWNIGKMFE
jgi:hypothetical protein